MENINFGDRLAALRMQKKVSAREMSLAIGQNESYINRIENHHTKPSMDHFYRICDYLEISPATFFDEDNSSPYKISEISKSLEKLSDLQLEALGFIARDMAKK